MSDTSNYLDSAGQLGNTLTQLNYGGGGGGGSSGGGLGLGSGLTLSALGSLLGTYANQQGISKASDLINQYGGQALTGLNTTNAANQALNQNLQGQLQGNLGSQGGLYGNTNQALYGTAGAAQNALGNIYNQQLGFQSPYQTTGNVGANALVAEMPYLTNQFNASDLNSQLAPNYNFMLQQGQMANQRAANALGGGFGGNALQGLDKFTQDYAGNAYQNAFNNYQTQRGNIYNTLAGMAGIGTTSGGQLTSLGNTLGSNIGNTYNTLSSNLLGNAGQMQNAYNNYGNNLTSSANALLNANTQYGTNLANLATGLGGAQAQNATASAQANAGALQSIGNTALLSSLLSQQPSININNSSTGGGSSGSSSGCQLDLYA